MEDYQIRIQSLVLAAYVEALGMQAENMQRSALGESMAYTESDFHNIAESIKSYTNILR